MAKQKKKKSKKIQLSRKEKSKFSAFFFIWIVILIVLLNFRNDIYSVLVKLIYGKNIFYAEPKIGFFLILTAILFLAGIILFISFYESAISLRIPFKEYFSGKSSKSKKQIQHFLICFSVWFILLAGAFLLSAGSCTIANTDGLLDCNLLKEDTTVIFQYDDVKQVNVSLDYRNFAMANGLLVHPSGYDLVIEIKNENARYKLYDEFFNENYIGAEKLLMNFNDDIIKVDDSNYGNIHISNGEKRDALKRIFER